MKIIDETGILETWKDFTNKHGLKVIEKSHSPFFSAGNRSKKILTVERVSDFFIFYKNLYYPLNSLKRSDYLRISLPVETDIKFTIRRSGYFCRFFLGNSIRIIPENSIEIHKSLREYISEKFKRFSDLRIRTTQYSFHEFGLPQRDLKILEIHTKKLPTDVIELDSLRDLTLKVFSYFREQNIIKPVTNIE
jgi:hypothetical protein